MLKIKIGGVYKISIGEYYYIGYSVDVMSRWSNHLTHLYLGKHHSVLMQEIFNKTFIEDFRFEILEHFSKTDFKKKSGLKGKAFESEYRKALIVLEKEWMSRYSVKNALNTDIKHFNTK